MGVDVSLVAMQPVDVYCSGYTHNVIPIAREAGIYEAIWRPEEIGIDTAGQLIAPLEKGLKYLRENRERLLKLNPANGWGDVDSFTVWVSDYLDGCREYPAAKVEVCR